jgi:hypothetical protein
LLVLAGEVVSPDCGANVLEDFEEFALRMECLALPAMEQPKSKDTLDFEGFILFRDRRKREDVPITALEHSQPDLPGVAAATQQ